jgi:RHS repeat-associated protein
VPAEWASDGVRIELIAGDPSQNREQTVRFDKAELHITPGDRFQYTGQEYDTETQLYYYGARYYDAGVGRFTTQDPLGTIDGTNLYTHVRNNPVNLIDPTGMASAGIYGSPGGNAGGANYGGQSVGEAGNDVRIVNALSNAGMGAPTNVDSQHARHVLSQAGRFYQEYATGSGNAGISTVTYTNADSYVVMQLAGQTSDRAMQQYLFDAASRIDMVSSEGKAAKAANHAAYQEWARWNTGFVGTVKAAVQITVAAHEGAQIGVTANVNAIADTAVSTVTLGQYSAGEVAPVADWMRSNYDTSYAFARGGYEVFAGVGTGGLATLKHGSTSVRVAAGAARAYDLAGNASGVVQGGFDAYHNGLNVANATQIVGGGLGSATTIIRVPRSSNPNRLHQGPVHHIATDKGAMGKEFKRLFDSVGLSMQSPYNRMRLSNHAGPHGIYNDFVYERLKRVVRNASSGDAKNALIGELKRVRSDIRHGSWDALLGAPASRTEQTLTRGTRR